MARRDEPAQLVLGPILRYAGTESATFWVQTSAPCELEVLGRRTTTFTVEGHHFALLLVDDLEPASVTPYNVRLDGHEVWPYDDGRPAPAVHTRDNEPRVRLAFGSCRVGGPQPASTESPWPDDLARTGIDALWAYARQLQRREVEWPDVLVLLGDQVYADEVSPATAEFIRGRRDVREPPGEEIADFEEYTQLYRETWSDPDIRWLLSTVPSVMIFDDHDVNDDWNISWSWVKEMREQAWWDDSHHRCLHVVLDLPAHREPLSTRARGGTAARPRSWRQRRRPTPTPGGSSMGSRVGRLAMGLLPRLRRLATARARLPCGTGARRELPRDDRRRRSGIG
jgi:hypothetical protein